MRRQLLSLAAVILTAGLIATPSASAQQSVNFFIGGFSPTPLDAAGVPVFQVVGFVWLRLK